jgi:hypothetical protein
MGDKHGVQAGDRTGEAASYLPPELWQHMLEDIAPGNPIGLLIAVNLCPDVGFDNPAFIPSFQDSLCLLDPHREFNRDKPIKNSISAGMRKTTIQAPSTNLAIVTTMGLAAVAPAPRPRHSIRERRPV